MILGGETLTGSLLGQLKQIGGTCEIVNHYGPTEMTIGALVNRLGLLQEIANEETALLSVPIGRPLANTQAYILDEEGCIVPVGVTGELYLAGAGMAAGYLHQQEQTNHVFSWSLGENKFEVIQVYRTGDVAQYNTDGKVKFIGRMDNQVKIRGNLI